VIGRTIAIGLAVAATASMAQPAEQRLQVGQYKPETPLDAGQSQPQITGVRWSEGDLEVLIEHPAPCGAWIPVNPKWDVSGSHITLAYDWLQTSGTATDAPRLCMKHLRAWVFRVPEAAYEVRMADEVPRLWRTGNVAKLP